MKLSKQEFIEQPCKAITLIGMSGAGKTYISSQLARWGWTNYSGDFVIGDRYMRDVLNFEGEFTAENISALSDYLGQLGDEAQGGIELREFRKRQKEYYDAECQSLAAMKYAYNSEAHFVHDSTGSLCEVEDEVLLREVGEQTLFVYLKTDAETEKDVLKRAYEYPKPLFFPPAFLDKKLSEYLEYKHLSDVNEIKPDDFSRWVFPLLFEARKPKYQRLADLYGVTIPSSKFQNLTSSDAFIDIVAEALS